MDDEWWVDVCVRAQTMYTQSPFDVLCTRLQPGIPWRCVASPPPIDWLHKQSFRINSLFARFTNFLSIQCIRRFHWIPVVLHTRPILMLLRSAARKIIEQRHYFCVLDARTLSLLRSDVFVRPFFAYCMPSRYRQQPAALVRHSVDCIFHFLLPFHKIKFIVFSIAIQRHTSYAMRCQCVPAECTLKCTWTHTHKIPKFMQQSSGKKSHAKWNENHFNWNSIKIKSSILLSLRQSTAASPLWVEQYERYVGIYGWLRRW